MTREGGTPTWMAGGGLALLLFLAGCGRDPEGYDASTRYPLRTDPLVLRSPTVAPTAPAAPGKLDEALAALPKLGGQIARPESVPEAERQNLLARLEAMFGTPAQPAIPSTLGDVTVTPDQLALGSRVYRRLCTQCHGLTGDGRGPTGPWVYPHPRDFRPGVFKVAIGSSAPTMTQLETVIRHGIPGTAMPPFDLISPDEVHAVAAYVVHLTARGQVEYQTIRTLTNEDEGADTTASAEVDQAWPRVERRWASPRPALPTVPDEPHSEDSIRRGYKLFTDVGCLQCHHDYGRADHYQYDVWGTVVRPSELTRAEWRWGREPAVIAGRIRHGIPGANMPAHPTLSDAQLSDLTRFVLALPYPPQLPADVRQAVYPSP